MKDYSSRELILKVFSGERTDRVANFDLLRNRKAVEFFSESVGKRAGMTSE